jgi:hypothetical protein
MKPSWTLRQVLAILRGIVLMVALFWALLLLQLVPTLVRGGLAGVRDHIARVSVAGVPPEHWDIAISRMYLALGMTFAIGIVLFLAQRYLGRRLATRGGSARRA